jgi:hypothetical protein
MAQSADDMQEEGFIDKPDELLPAWFTGRMMNDVWSFGLLTVTNHVFYIESITAIHRDANGEVWLDVKLQEGSNKPFGELPGTTLVGAPTSRTDATIKASHVVAAFELADT